MKEEIMHGKRLVTIIALALAGVAFLAVGAQATAYTWTGTNSNAWNDTTSPATNNWGVTTGAFPNAYTDTASIPGTTGLNKPVVLSTTALLGGGGNTTLNIGGASTGSTVNALDINSTGTLGMQGGITIGSRRTLSVEGTLRNDSASPGTNYTVTGSSQTNTLLNGGTISSLHGGGWTNLSFTSTGASTISAPITGAFTVSGGTLDLNNYTVTASGNTTGATVNSGATLNINSGATLALNNGNAELIANGTVNLNGGTVKGLSGSFSNYFGGPGTINVTADSTLSGSIGNDTTNHGGLKPINIGGTLGAHTLSLDTFTDGGISFAVGAGGTLDNKTGASSFGNGSSISMLGGSVTNTGGGAFSFSGPGTISGYGNVSGLTSVVATVTASGGTAGTPQTLFFNGGTGTGTNLGSTSGTGMSMTTAGANNTLDVQGNFNVLNPVTISPNGGIVNLTDSILQTPRPGPPP